MSIFDMINALVCAALVLISRAERLPSPLAAFCDGEYARTDLLKSMEASLASEMAKPIEEAMQRQQAPVIMTVSSRHVSCMSDNFVNHANEALTVPSTIVAVNLDQQSMDACLSHPLASNVNATGGKTQKKADVQCVNLAGWLPKELDAEGASGKVDNVGYGGCSYHVLVWAKPQLLKKAVKYSKHGVLLMDSDIILHGDLLQWVQANRRHDIAMMTEQWKGKPWPSTGAVYADQNSEGILKKWVDACTANHHFHGDTEELKDLLLRADDDVHKVIQFIPNEILGECAEKGGWATHYNCVAKISTMTQHGVWLPHDPACK